MNNRRKLLVAFGASALVVPLASFAQQQRKVWRIGSLWEGEQSEARFARQFDAFKEGMRELGYAEGRDYMIEHRFTGNDFSRIPALAAELVASKVDIIVSSGTPSAVALHAATREIPVLIVTIGDPVGSGLAATLHRPGGNVTGLTGLNTELDAKRLDLLRQMLPHMRRVGFLYNPDSVGDARGLGRFQSACATLGLQPVRAPLRRVQEIAVTFDQLKRDKAQGLLVSSSSAMISWNEHIIEQAARHRLPAMYARASDVSSQQLISYSVNRADVYRRVAAYADKIFKGAKPADIPIEQPTKFELIINMKIAKALGIKIPQSILVQATKVIE
jgi:putative ABC transport system substrate-binding protein